MSDDFFDDLDGKIASLNAEQAAQVAKKDADLAFSQNAISAMHPMAEQYVAKLGERGITAKVSGSEDGITFEMRWKDGGEHGFSIYPDPNTGRLKISQKSTDHIDGKRFSSTDGNTYGQDNWEQSRFESLIKSVISSYMSLARHHEGIV